MPTHLERINAPTFEQKSGMELLKTKETGINDYVDNSLCLAHF